MHPNSIRLATLSGLAGMLLLQPACSEDGSAPGSLVVLNRMRSALTAAQVASVNGTYGAACTNRTGAWSAAVAGGTMTNPALSVIQNDTDCVLTLTQVKASKTGTLGTLAANPAIALTTSYEVTPSSFGTPLEFYANAHLSAVTFAAPFILTLLYSDDSGLAVASNTAQFQVTSASVTAQSVPAPEYTLDVSGLIVTTDIDNVIVSSTGTAALTDTGQDAQTYVVVSATDLDTYVEIDTAYTGVVPTAFAASIPSSDFAIGTGVTLPQIRTLILANLANGVRSYKAFQITFNAPPITP
jgi:hypothetical protein